MFHVARLLVTAAFSLAVAAPASAANTLAPVFTVAGVVNNGFLATFFACTNTDKALNTISIAVFDQAGTLLNDPNGTQKVDVAPQGTALFGTNVPAGLSIDSQVTAAGITKGSAQILATSNKIVCTAFLADRATNPPSTMMTLTVAAKGKQKGD